MKVAHEQLLGRLARPDGAVEVVLVAPPGAPSHVEIRRVRGEARAVTQALRADDLDPLLEALREARRLLLGAPTGREGIEAAQEAAGLRRPRAKRRS